MKVGWVCSQPAASPPRAILRAPIPAHEGSATCSCTRRLAIGCEVRQVQVQPAGDPTDLLRRAENRASGAPGIRRAEVVLRDLADQPLRSQFSRLSWCQIAFPVDTQAPDDRFSAIWRKSDRRALDCIRDGGKVLVHCRGGLGRAGTVASALLMELGLDTQAAIARVRRARPGAVETQVQEEYLARYAITLGLEGEGV